MVFVPSISTFIISRMLGGGSNLLIGDLIELQFLGNSYNSVSYTHLDVYKRQDARKVLEYALQDKAAADKAAVDELVAQGMSRSEASAQCDTDENFAAWFADFSQRLEATQKGE